MIPSGVLTLVRPIRASHAAETRAITDGRNARYPGPLFFSISDGQLYRLPQFDDPIVPSTVARSFLANRWYSIFLTYLIRSPKGTVVVPVPTRY